MREDYWLKPDARDLVMNVGPHHEHRNLMAARDAIRALPARKRQQTIRVLVHDGTYFLTKPLALRAEDSGRPGAPIIYQAAPGNAPCISGGVRIIGWRKTRVKGRAVWTASLPAVKRGAWYFTQLYVNGQRRSRPRLPREGFHYFRRVNAGPADQAGFFRNDIRAWKNFADVEVIVPHYWVDSHLLIRKINARKREVYFAAKSVRSLDDEKRGGTSRYWVENVADALDTPGQWYLDRKKGILTYLPLPGEDPDKTDVVAPKLQKLVRIEGTPSDNYKLNPTEFRFRPEVAPARSDARRRVETLSQATVHDIHLVGLTFCHTGWNYPRNSAGAGQSASSVPGALHVCHAADCSIRLCRVTLTENYAVELAGGARRIAIVGNRLDDLGAGGVKLGHESHFNVVSDNIISHGGRRYPSAIGVWIGHSGDNIIASNLIHDFYYSGISVGWVWGYTPSAARRNLILNNRIHTIGQGFLSDLGGIYSLGVSPGTHISGNVIHNVHCYDYGASGLYPDEGSSCITYENNVVWDTDTGSVSMNYGRDCLFRNNLLMDARDNQVRWGTPKSMSPFRFEQNVVIFNRGSLLSGTCLEGIPQMEFARNVYWQTTGRPFDFAGVSWDQWRAHGFDKTSRVADPLLFRDDDKVVAFRRDSPALALGFIPPTLSAAGPRSEVLATGHAPARPHRAGPIVWSRIECAQATEERKGEMAFMAYPDQTPCTFLMRAIMENAGDAAFDGEIEFYAAPADCIKGAPRTRLSAHIAPGKCVTLELPLRVKADTEEVLLKTASKTAEGFWPTSLSLGFRTKVAAFRLPANIRIEKVRAALAMACPGKVAMGERTLGTFRVGVAGDCLALAIDVADTGVEIKNPVYAGSMVDIFGMSPNRYGEFGQAFLVPAGNGRPARLINTDMSPVRGGKLRFEALPRGYRMQALIPLPTLKIEILNDEFAFRGAIYTHAPGFDRIVRQALFNPRSPRDIHAYGLYKLQKAGVR